MNTPTMTTLLALSLAGSSMLEATTLSLVKNTNPGDVTGGGNNSVSQIGVGQTLYIAIPYAGAAWQSSEATDYFSVSTFLLGDGGASSVSFNFFTAIDNGDNLSAITQLDAANITAGSASVAAAAVGLEPSDLANTSVAGVSAQIGYADQVGNPFGSITNGILWLGITNTGANTVMYYASALGGTPAPAYQFDGPFDTGATSLLEDTYIYDTGTGSLVGGHQNIHPYLTLTAETVPEPTSALLAGLAVLGFLGYRRRSA